MTRNPITVQKVVTLLSDAHPTFVSLVGHGANQTPFKSVKVAELPQTQPIADTTMSKPAEPVTKGAVGAPPAGTEINKIVFAGEQFPTDAAVTTYLTAKGYSNFAVEAVDSSFVVKAMDENAFESITPIAATDAGVTFFVGKLAAGADPIATAVIAAPVVATKAEVPVVVVARERTKVSKAEVRRNQFKVTKADETPDQLVQKYCDYYCCCGPEVGELTLADAIADVNCGLPVGYWDVNDAFRQALRNRILTGDVAGIAALATQFGEILVKLCNICSTTTMKSEDNQAAIDALLPSRKDFGTQVPKVVAIPAGTTDPIIAQPGTIPATPGTIALPTGGNTLPVISQPGTIPAVVAGAVVVPGGAGSPAEPLAQPGTLPAVPGAVTLPTGTVPVVPSDLGSLATAMTTLQNTLNTLIQGQTSLATKSDISEVSEKVTKAEGRLTVIEEVRQIRKSADSDDATVNGGAGSPAGEAPKLTKTQKNILGIQ